jgi:hypothetical protein
MRLFISMRLPARISFPGGLVGNEMKQVALPPTLSVD